MLTQSLTSGATPFLYGVINDKYRDQYPWLAMVSVMSLQFVAVPFLIILAILRNRRFKDEESRRETNRGEELIDEDEKEKEKEKEENKENEDGKKV